MSYGVIGSKQVADVAAVFAPGALELRGIVTESVAAASVPPRHAVSESKPAPAKTAQNATATKAIPEAEDDTDW